jgi:DNA (cytosine-5)-methyltransferase 1
VRESLSTALEPHEAKSLRNESSRRPRSLRVVGLFAGIGGIELGMARAGHRTVSLCEIDPAAAAVLGARFRGIPLSSNVEDYDTLPKGTQLITAGFPCQDLSQAGRTAGINNGASQSGLVGEVLRLLMTHDVRWVLLENVPFMLHLARGKSLEVLIDNLEELGFSWAYRVVNSRAFGVPQRRERVYLLASRTEDPRNVLLVDDVREPTMPGWTEDLACGFYWTEGTAGLGWAVDAVPTLKNGSTVGIASPPAILLPSGEVVKPGIRDAERMQGFEPDWTKPAEEVARPSIRWKLIGNAVTVDAAEWIGRRLAEPGHYEGFLDEPLQSGRSWPRAAYNVGGGRYFADVTAWPMHRRGPHLHEFLTEGEMTPLSLRAISGFLSRYEASTLKKPPRFLEALRAHKRRMEESSHR